MGRYPSRLLADGSITVFEMGEQGLRRRAYEHIGEVVARTFYYHVLSRFEEESIVETSHLEE